MTVDAEARPANRLAGETSPYLLQHARNPVDWYPWGEEAFAKARAQDKPILLSVGYATCHWCHVMERESFEDEAIARQLAEGFVAIKVDREELPDVDHVYMSALQALTGQGGWPMSVFLTPRLEPFFGGTYFPPQPRRGLPSFAQVLIAVREAWLQRRAEIEEQARALMAHMQAGTAPVPGTPGSRLHARALARLAERFDTMHGGFGSAPKFPQSPLLHYLLSLAALGDQGALGMLLPTLHHMAAGGVYDHVGGGFARYSTDARWHVPHFEKMLYDNAQLARAYAGAWRLTGDPRLRFVAEDTLAWMQREMHPAAASAAYASAQDADAEGIEGRFHVWTLDQLREVLGVDAEDAARLYGVTEHGNWEHGINVLQRLDPEAVRTAMGLQPEDFVAWERSVRERLYGARAKRVWPLTDDKVLADWNGLALRAYAEVGRLFERDDYVQAGRDLAHFLLDTLVREGQVHHAWRNGTLKPQGYLADHAQLGLGLVELHAATGEPDWLQAACTLCERMIERYHDADEGFFDATPGELPLRAREIQDGPVQSGTAAACELLLRLAGPFDRADWAALAHATLERHGALMEDRPMAVPALLQAQLLVEHGAELAVPSGPGSEALWDEARRAYAPLVTRVHGPAGSLPLLAKRRPGEAYLCREGRCALPATSPGQLRKQLA